MNFFFLILCVVALNVNATPATTEAVAPTEPAHLEVFESVDLYCGNSDPALGSFHKNIASFEECVRVGREANVGVVRYKSAPYRTCLLISTTSTCCKKQYSPNAMSAILDQSLSACSADRVAECCTDWSEDCYKTKSHENNYHTCQMCGGYSDPCHTKCSDSGKTPDSDECKNCCLSQTHETPWNCPAPAEAKPCTGELNACLDDMKTDPCVCLANYKDANGPWEDCAITGGMLNTLYDQQCEDAEADRVQRNKEADEKENAEKCEDVEPPVYFRNNSCAKQKANSRCATRIRKDSMYCRKTCGLCGDEPKEHVPDCYDLPPPAWFKNNTCELQLSAGKCPKRNAEDSKYCRKTCGTCSALA